LGGDRSPPGGSVIFAGKEVILIRQKVSIFSFIFVGVLGTFGLVRPLLASETLTVPNSMDPGQMSGAALSAMGNYIPVVLTLVIVVAFVLAVIALVKRLPKRAVK
jgi:hypothetical protein